MVVPGAQIELNVNCAGYLESIIKADYQRYCYINVSAVSSRHQRKEEAHNMAVSLENINTDRPTVSQLSPSPTFRRQRTGPANY